MEQRKYLYYYLQFGQTGREKDSKRSTKSKFERGRIRDVEKNFGLCFSFMILRYVGYRVLCEHITLLVDFFWTPVFVSRYKLGAPAGAHRRKVDIYAPHAFFPSFAVLAQFVSDFIARGVQQSLSRFLFLQVKSP